MKKALTIVFIILLITCNVSLLFGWGFWAHQRVNRAAVFALPPEMRSFFYNHIDFITEEAVIPDVRIYAINDKAEVNRHWVNLELLRTSRSEPMPQTMKEASAKYDTLLQKAGLLPWYIDEIMTKLTKAFQDRNKPYILFYAADLGHYIGDAHVPLHTTLNHDGVSTGQKGIHSFWESQLPEKFGDAYSLNTGDARYIADVQKEIWRIIENSYSLVDTVLLTEKKLNTNYPAEKVYETDSAGKIVKNKYNQSKHSLEYSLKYHQVLNGMVENQMRSSIAAISNFWYTAWVNGGKPDLAGLDPETLTKRNKKIYRKEMKLWQKGRLFGLRTANEF